MTRQDILTLLMPYHKLIEDFDYSLAVEWAMYCVEAGNTNVDILMLASFEKYPETLEIIPYLNRAVNVKEPSPENTIKSVSLLGALYCSNITEGKQVYESMKKIDKLYELGVVPEFEALNLLSWARLDFDFGEQHTPYYETTPERIGDDVKMEAQKFLDAVLKIDSPLRSE